MGRRARVAIVLCCAALILDACGSDEGGSEKPSSSEEDRTAASREGGEERGYAAIADDTGALSVEAPSEWSEVLTGEDAKFEGESVGPSITVSTDLHAWHNTGEASGVFFRASRELAQRYTDDQLLDSEASDFSGSCDLGTRRDFDRPPYSGKIREWKNCSGNEESSFLTLAAAPEGRECVLALQVGTFDEADIEGIQRVLDTFEADCGRIPRTDAFSAPKPPDDKAKGRPIQEDDPDGARRGFPCPEGSAASNGGCVEAAASGSATGVLEKPEITTYQYGTHAITDDASGAGYALASASVNLDDYVGQRVTVYGVAAPGYEDGQVEGGPPLLSITRVETA